MLVEFVVTSGATGHDVIATQSANAKYQTPQLTRTARLCPRRRQSGMLPRRCCRGATGRQRRHPLHSRLCSSGLIVECLVLLHPPSETQCSPELSRVLLESACMFSACPGRGHPHVSALHAALVRVLHADTEWCIVVQHSAQLYSMSGVERFCFLRRQRCFFARLAQSANPGAL